MSLRRAKLLIIAFLWIWAPIAGGKEQKSKTWYLQETGGWKQLSEDCKKAFLKGNEYYKKGDYSKAATWYKKFIRECESESRSRLYSEILKRQFKIGKEYLHGRKHTILWLFRVKAYSRGVKIMESVAKHAGERDIGLEAQVEIARSYERRAKKDSDKYFPAYRKWQEIFENYESNRRCRASEPTGVIGKDALLGMARARLKAYKGPAYDASVLGGRPLSEKKYENAKGCYRIFQNLYPQDAEELGINEKIREINKKLTMKDLHVADYYRKQEKAGVIEGKVSPSFLYYNMIINQWPDTRAAEKARERLAENENVQKLE